MISKVNSAGRRVAMSLSDPFCVVRHRADFAALIERRGVPVRLVEGAGLNHFEVINTLASPFGLLGRIALQQMGLGLG